MASFTERMIGSAMLRARTYEEVEADSTAMGQAMGVVVLSGVAAGLGAWGSSMALEMFIALASWFVWALLTFVIGTKLLPEPQTRSDLGELLRTIGFSASPGVLRIFGVVPVVGWLISIVASFWMLAAMVIAIRQALDFSSTWRAVAVCAVGFVPYLFLRFLVI